MPKSSLIPSEWETGSFYDKWSFSVANSMLQEGEKKPLELNDLLHIPIRDHSDQMLPAFREAYMTSKAIWFLPRLMVAQIRWAYIDVIIVSAITVVEAGCMIVSPLLLNYLLKALENEDSDADCYMYAALLSGVGIIQVFIHHVVFFISMRLGWNWKNVTTALIHEKLIQMDVNVLQSSGSGTGMLVNMISNDVARFEELPIYGSSFWVSLLVVAAVLVELIFVLDVPSAVAGAGTALVMLPVMIQLAKLFAKYRGQTAASTDGRVRYISEVIEGIASVKSYAWETAFFQMIRKLRASETKYIARSQVLKALNQGFMFCMSSLVSFSTFAVFWANGGTLTIPLVFSTIALLQVLRFQIGRAWIRSIESGSEAIASSLRIERFLDLKAVSDSNSNSIAAGDLAIANTVPVCSLAADEVLSIKPSSYCYGTNTDAPVLKGLSLSVSKGELLMVVGPVGSGKSSLLAVALGELHAMKASATDEKATSTGPARCIAEDCRIAYCAQRPWILAASVKSNITLAGKYLGEGKVNYKHPTNIDQALYAMAVESALIVDDFKQWAAYDDTEVGERGISVSGGQKARISLARAIYADSDLYLLDDPLSAVDAHVGHALMTNCIVDTLKKRNKAVILATHQLQNLKFADKILVLDGSGNQVFYGTHAALLSSPEVMASLDIIAAEAEKSSTHDDEDSGYSSPKIGLGKGSNARSRGGSVGTAEALLSSNPGLSAAGLEKAAVRKFGTKYDPEFRNKARAVQLELEAAAAKVTELPDVEAGAMTETALETQRRQVVQKEVSETGNMSWAVYWRYASSGGALSGVSALTVICLSQAVVMITEYWLRWWAKGSFGDQSQNKYVSIYAGLVVCCILIGCYRALAWFRFTLRAASNLQERCLWAVIHSPMTFFVSNPTGRILNRFSKDQNQMDEMLPTTMFAFIESSVYCLASLVLICITIPWIAILVPFLVGFFVLLRRRYITSTREIKRIEAVTRSPIYADFSATLEGLTTLRAYKLQSRVSSLFQEQIDENGRPWFSFLLCARWLGLRLDMETAVVLAFVCFLSVILRTSIDVGLLGFALVYTLSLSGLFQLAVRWSVDVETQMTAVERISSYCQLPPEEGYATSLETALLETESQQHIAAASKYQAVDTAGDTELQGRTLLTSEKEGHLTINDMTATYRRDLDPVLRHINIDIPAGFKVGICGRTGSGKSSSLLALLRLNIITSGDIVLDGESLLALDLQSARSRLSIIPQDPHLFSGTIRFNLDPFSAHSDSDIWGALQDAHIHDHIKADPLGLSALVEESGKNFSVGQRQLLSLARAILRRSKVVLMDEVTASIDYLTDRLIQETIRTSPALRDSTIITVAHRLRTIADSDLIVVVQAGEVIEMGAPGTLLLEAKGQANHNSEFTRLVQESNEYDEIFRIATSMLNSKQ